jgi:hypothetical protein
MRVADARPRRKGGTNALAAQARKAEDLPLQLDPRPYAGRPWG